MSKAIVALALVAASMGAPAAQDVAPPSKEGLLKIGRASCRERVLTGV